MIVVLGEIGRKAFGHPGDAKQFLGEIFRFFG
jgi:hypothetical protein